MSLLCKIKNAPSQLYFEAKRYLNQKHRYDFASVNNGWKKIGDKPIWGNRELGTMFDPYAFMEDLKIKMVVSARKQNSLILIDSEDGYHWNFQKLLLKGRLGKWDEIVNRGCLLLVNNKYYLWYTGQRNGKASIGLAISDNGQSYLRVAESPVLEADKDFEGVSVMNPCVLWDTQKKCFKMWYSAGETYEPDIICYAESKDGVLWKKHFHPVLAKYPQHEWEKYKVGGCQVIQLQDGSFKIYYIGYQNLDVARICMANSTDGIKWERNDENLLISPSKNAWDADAVYKPTIVEKDNVLFMWYNGRNAHEEYIGLAIKKND
jgi:predicted GH43/DUF377 family glycosyl hydrolase